MLRCTNAEPGTFNHECGKPATWAGTHKSGHVQHFCDRCKLEGWERHGVVSWWPLNADGSNKPIGEMTKDERRAVMLAARARFLAKGEPLKAAMAQIVVEAAR